jgi:tetratricopeptide (TPR) repeat protein
MLYAYEKLDLRRLRQTKIGSYRLEMSKPAIGQNATNQWWKVVLLICGLLGLLGIGYYFFPNILAIQTKSDREITKMPLPSDNSEPNLLSIAETKTLSPPNLSSTQIISTTNLVNIVENQSLNSDNGHSIKPSLESIPIQPKEMQPPLKPNSVPEMQSPLQSTPIQPKATQSPKLTKLLQQCDQYLQANYLTTGKTGNAFDCYQQILAQVPNQVEAKNGLQQIETLYQRWILAALRQEQYAKVHRYWQKLQLVNPQSTLLTQIETDLQQKITLALSAKQLTQANRYLENLAKLNSNSSVLPTLKQNLAKVITTWLQQCEQHFQANRLTLGKSGNALECYQQLLSQDPHNRKAKVGLTRIEKRYQQWTKQALQQKKLSSARKYLMRLQQVNPRSSQLSQLRQQLLKLEQQPINSKSSAKVSPNSFSSSSLPSSPTHKAATKKTQLTPSVKAVAKKIQPTPSVGTAKGTQPTHSVKATAKKTQPTHSNKAATKKTQPTHSRSSLQSSKQCSDIFMQESLGIRPLTQKQKAFKLQYCNK